MNFHVVSGDYFIVYYLNNVIFSISKRSGLIIAIVLEI